MRWPGLLPAGGGRLDTCASRENTGVSGYDLIQDFIAPQQHRITGAG
jgi:hypothetical protein